jgi:acetyl-CoA C-acetyltransferase
MPKAGTAWSRTAEVFDTTIGWRFVNPVMRERYGTHAMPETAEIVATRHGIARDDQDAFALRSQERAAKAIAGGVLAREIEPVPVPQRKGEPVLVATDEHPRVTSLEALARLRPLFPDGTVTAGNSSGINDGAAAVLVASEEAVRRYDLEPLARIGAGAVAGVHPEVMGIGPVPATRKVLGRAGLEIGDVDVVELNEAFAAQALAVLRELGLPDDAEHVNAHGGAIALGHPLGASGARLALTAAHELRDRGGRRALATMCIGVGQGNALLQEAVS